MEPAKVQNDHTSDHISSPENDHQREKSTDDDNTGVGRSYECTFCKRGFTNAQALGGHMNIHRKDKAKVKLQNKINQGGGPSKLLANDHQDYSNLRYFPQIPSSDHQQQQEIGGYIYRPAVNYQVYLPASNPNFQTANYFPGWKPDSPFEGRLDANLGLSIGQPEGGDGDLDVKKNEVDLELRLGHNIDR